VVKWAFRFSAFWCLTFLARAANTVRVDYRVFQGPHAMDGNWVAVLAASDGKVVDDGNLTDLAGEAGLRIGPQSTIHSRFGEGADGRIYFGTHGGH
jgi:hypothetical protein